MTKLLQWVVVLSLIFAVYISIVSGLVATELYDKYPLAIQLSPIVLVLLFGIYSVFTILYRIYTFNDCPEASKELQLQIQEARKDLIAKGFKFRD